MSILYDICGNCSRQILYEPTGRYCVTDGFLQEGSYHVSQVADGLLREGSAESIYTLSGIIVKHDIASDA